MGSLGCPESSYDTTVVHPGGVEKTLVVTETVISPRTPDMEVIKSSVLNHIFRPILSLMFN
jgi:hypothetical protein